MLQTPADFTPLMRMLADEAAANPLTFTFRAGELLVREHDLALPDQSALQLHGVSESALHALGLWQARLCCTTWVSHDTPAAPGWAFKNLRALFGVVDDELISLAGRAFQIAEWARTHRYCGACATPMQMAPGERAFTCPACHMTAYPRISPAMMVLVRKGDAVLLARHTHSPTGRFSPLAGFLEAGESVEEAIHREVMEEVGLKVNNLRYFGSQSWPFPHSLMIAYTAEYVSGEIRVDENEIAEARWFSPQDAFDKPYPEVSISGKLVNTFFPAKS
ncbi:MAG: hypothetical protein RL748_4140 [Pseudomonadota bacterium]|jgi:NAD+ diphosphatase